MAQGEDARKRPENCFRCWHCRRVDGLSSCCVCMVNVTKKQKPEFITEPYSGLCPQFYDKRIEEAKAASFIAESD